MLTIKLLLEEVRHRAHLGVWYSNALTLWGLVFTNGEPIAFEDGPSNENIDGQPEQDLFDIENMEVLLEDENSVTEHADADACTSSLGNVETNDQRKLSRRRMGWDELAFSTRRPTKKPLLTPSMVEKRFKWAKEHQNWTVEDWKRILSDKSGFVRRRRGEKLNSDCLSKRVKHPLSIMVWSMISFHGSGRLYIMRRDQYIQVLATKMLPRVWEWFSNKNFIYMHNSA
ncbi:hypothetical protein ILUMI_24744 [Ignelater luminosus]|uniref:Uncharacterized protein n=1 Tax=Ignelater luminosus TaxID=2038154 RepID=A0A8K0CBX4_IGNLU|nr:hypothetical protein ILUMI_24744 [Ignelater luminosus]